MKLKIILATLVLGIPVLMASAQDDGPPPGGPGGPGGMHRRPPLPLIVALDANHDGVIDANEIANASAALKTLDKNGDGQLTKDEYLPPRPSGASGTHHPPMPAILKALDANGDGVIDASEIATASAALKTLDKNGDGQLTRDEYLGPRPPRPSGENSGDGPPSGPPPDDK
jgi:Ca2+-binding EF-hand superfamily protein